MHNHIRQKEGEIEDYKMERDALKWCKEHIPRDGNDLTKEGQLLLEDPELWLDRLTFLRNVNFMHRENENTLQRTAHSCYTTKELLHPPLQETGSKCQVLELRVPNTAAEL